jgi:taurine dioxygenase
MREMVDGLTAVHSARPVLERMQPGSVDTNPAPGFENVHPLVRVHPETGRKALFINPSFVTRIVELTPAESARLIALLSEHVKSPDFWMRWRWSPNDIAIWDNRSVLHYAVPDYTEERFMQRVFVAGDRPRGPR